MRRNTRSDIVDAAMRLFSERGFEGVSTREIAKAVGIASPSIYKHFSSINEIISEMLEIITERRSIELKRIALSGADPSEKVKRLALNIIVDFMQDQTLLHLYQQILTPQAGRALDMATAIWDIELVPMCINLIKQVDPDCDASSTYFILFSFLLGSATYLPHYETRWSLSADVKSPLCIAERGLATALPAIKWKQVPPTSASGL